MVSDVESEFFASDAVDDDSVRVGCESVDEGAADLPLEEAFVHWCPSALGVVSAFFDLPVVVWVYEGEVGIVAWSNESSLVDAEKACGVV